jgi:Pentapeptide repeats (8 copies)
VATREGQVTDRFIRAIDQLGATDKDGKPVREIRLGGIYGLSRIAQDSYEDYKPIRKILSDYVRMNAPWRPHEESPKGSEKREMKPSPTAEPHHPETDIQAALDFLWNPIDKYEKRELTRAFRPVTDLRGATLSGAHLKGATLAGAHLEAADLGAPEGTHQGADLEKAILYFAHLQGADLYDADLEGAILSGADLRGAHLEGADLSTAIGLTQAQVDSAYGDVETRLPPGIRMPEDWKQNRARG